MRVVLDTNTILSALLFESDRLTWIRDAWVAGLFVPLCSLPTSEELIRVLAYPKFGLSEEDIRVLVGAYVRCAEVIHVASGNTDALPRCRDPKDQMFLELAMCGDADVLVTGDRDLSVLDENCEFSIQSPAEFRKRFGRPVEES